MTNLLLVDDNSIERLVVRNLLGKSPDLNLIEAWDGQEALDLLHAMPIDLVITDIRMPRMDGMELVRAVRREFPTLPVVVMTASGSERTAAEALTAGAVSYLPKEHLKIYLGPTIESLRVRFSEGKHSELLRGATIEQRVSRTLRTRCDWVPGLVAELSQLAVRAGICRNDDEFRLGVALEEALLNAIIHGNLEISSTLRESGGTEYEDLIREREQLAPYCERVIRVSTEVARDEIRYTIRDEGRGFDVTALPDPTDPENLLRASGRGVLLMRAFTDRVIYNEVGNEVTIEKHRHPEVPLPVSAPRLSIPRTLANADR